MHTKSSIALALTGIVLAAAPAHASSSDHVSIEEGYTDLCGDLVGTYTEESDLRWVSRPADGNTRSYTLWSSGWAAWTNADGRRVTMTCRKVDRDVRVTDNGDGSRVIRAMNNGLETYVGPDGTTLRNRGPIWLDVVVSDAGTPEDIWDDYWLEFLGFRMAGNWDMDEAWCDQMHTWLA